MKKGLWIGLGLLIIAHPIFAASPTMSYTAQPAGTVSSLPTSVSFHNAAPIPQDICSPTLSAGNQHATCSGLPVCRGGSTQSASFSCTVTSTCGNTVSASQSGGDCTLSLNVTKPSTLAAATAFSFEISYGSYSSVLATNAFTLNGTNPPPPSDSHRTITFKNSCGSNIWFGSITGAAPSKNMLSGGSIDCTGGDPGKQACVAAGGACYSRVNNPDACFSQACSSDSDCMSGASCYATTGKCFWNNPSPTNDTFELTTSGPGNTNTIEIPEYTANGIGVVWSGAFGGRTGCTTGTCTSALCTTGTENAQGVCSLGVGFQQPATQAEPTFITYPTGTTPATPTDAYDVTVINGANVPMAMYPTLTSTPTAGNNPYTCGFAGYNLTVPTSGGNATNTIGASSWSISTSWGTPPNPAYSASIALRYVVPTVASPDRCTDDSNCPLQTCGLTYGSQSIGSTTTPGAGHLVCGTFAGWFTADQICGTNNSFTTALGIGNAVVNNFQCTAPLSSPTGTMANLYQCNGNYANSCYSTGATSSCCGCADWGTDEFLPDFPKLAVPTNTTFVTACQPGAKNPSWTGDFTGTQPQVYDTVYFLKKACPSCYVYPFDDASSSFTCTTGTTSTNNTKNYTVEFCPGGNGSTNFAPT